MQPSSDTVLSIPRFKKADYLSSLPEDVFRDEVIRPLFLRLGYTDGRDLCGPNEKGKDAIFAKQDGIGLIDLVAIQTKKGNLNLSSSASSNLIAATTQLNTALQTPVFLVKEKKSQLPLKVILCASGKINEHARNHVVTECRDPRIQFLDSDDIIPLIDQNLPEFWFGIDAELTPYYRALKALIEGTDTSESRIAETKDILQGAATDKFFVPMKVFRDFMVVRKVRGHIERQPQFEEILATEIIKRSDRRVLILGEGGAGKTTVIKRLAYEAINRGLSSFRDYLIPILIPAVDLEKNLPQDLINTFDRFTKEVANTDRPCFSVKDLKEGRVIVLVDALDEIANDTNRVAIVRKLNEFSKQYPKILLVITTRQYSFLKDIDDLRAFVSYTVSPIDMKQAGKIVENLQRGQLIQKEYSKEILRRIEEVHGIELNPLLVTVFAAATDFNKQDIPANITELFKKFTELMLGRWDERKGLNQQFHAPLKDVLVQQIAYEMHRNKLVRIPRDQMHASIATYLEARGYKADVSQLLYEIVERSGLFRKFGSEIEFRHHLFFKNFLRVVVSHL